MSVALSQNLSGREMGVGGRGDEGTRGRGEVGEEENPKPIPYSLFPIPYSLLTATAFEENHHQNAENRL